MPATTLDNAAPVIDIELCALDELPIGLGRAFEVSGRSIAVFRTRAGTVHAVANTCPHRGGPLADGMLAGNRIVCPFHAFRYELSDGACDQPGACAIEVFPAEIREGQVYLTISAKS